tara:strand:- start:124532 stop:125083 length:552 start_codon:yes stop_codon:yes gene_type:complete
VNNRIEIPLSKKKITLLLIGSIAFVVCAVWVAIYPEKFIPNIFKIANPEIIRTGSIIGFLFFCATGIYGIRKLFDKKAGLIIYSEGIFDNTNASSIGLIEWIDIIEIRTEQIMSTKFLLIVIVNPEKYIGKAKNGMQVKLLKANMSLYKTPLSITSNTLKLNFGELEKLIQTEFRINKNAMQQ